MHTKGVAAGGWAVLGCQAEAFGCDTRFPWGTMKQEPKDTEVSCYELASGDHADRPRHHWPREVPGYPQAVPGTSF